MNDIGSTRTERKKYAKKNRKVTAIFMAVIGFFISPYIGSVFIELFSGLMNASFVDVKWNYFYHFTFGFKYLFRNTLNISDVVILEYGLPVVLISLVLYFIITQLIAYAYIYILRR